MKTRLWLMILFGVAAIVTARHCQGQVFCWQPILQEEVEFGVTAVHDGVLIESPSSLEVGYMDGAWWGGNPVDGLPYTGMAQTFIVPSPRTLKSIQLRVGRFNFSQPKGLFEVAVYRFDSLGETASQKLVAVLANAEDYCFDLTSVPVSSFDYSAFNLALNPTETYAVAVTPTATFSGGLLALQAAENIYPGGSAYTLSLVPVRPLGSALKLMVSLSPSLRSLGRLPKPPVPIESGSEPRNGFGLNPFRISITLKKRLVTDFWPGFCLCKSRPF